MTTDTLTDAVNTIDLLQSIYFDQEFQFDTQVEATLYETLHTCWETNTWQPLDLPSTLQFIIKAPIELPNEEDILIHLVFHGRLSLHDIQDYQLYLPAASNLWLSRPTHELLVNQLNAYQTDPTQDRSTWIIEKMQLLQDLAVPYAIQHLQEKKDLLQTHTLDDGPVRFLREWIWFPMIYTREKVKRIYKRHPDNSETH